MTMVLVFSVGFILVYCLEIGLGLVSVKLYAEYFKSVGVCVVLAF